MDGLTNGGGAQHHFIQPEPALSLSKNSAPNSMALAQEGEEIKARENQKTWKEIAQQINWKYGTSEAGVKKLEEARNLLKRANSDTLAHIAEWRKTRKTRK
jgi:pyrroline-5-carboxylate reductase